MAADLIAEAGGPLHIDPVAGRQLAQIGDPQGLLHQVEADSIAGLPITTASSAS